MLIASRRTLISTEDKQNDLSNQEVINECRTNDGAGLEPSPNGKTAAAGRGEHAGKVIPTDQLVSVLENLLAPGDRVVLEGNNQKQADFSLAHAGGS